MTGTLLYFYVEDALDFILSGAWILFFSNLVCNRLYIFSMIWKNKSWNNLVIKIGLLDNSLHGQC